MNDHLYTYAEYQKLLTEDVERVSEKGKTEMMHFVKLSDVDFKRVETELCPELKITIRTSWRCNQGKYEILYSWRPDRKNA